ncbi:complex 1 LYR [Pyrrhoderma noxium]|uniref:Complex 1 LYR n=1 Tax=Pyrrhoderma noxium TaxID=2282107 RepID=A0A286UMJ8_9AGAM|nr:complex 1 LYR [Pyrrhoderma noxium]
MASQCRAAYRSILREVAKSSISPRATRNREINQSFRTLIQSQCAKEGADIAKIVRDANNAAIFLRSQRIYTELLDRYNPLRDMTQEERVHATARRVGLDTPLEAKPDEEK